MATGERIDAVVGGSVSGLVVSDGLCDSAELADHGQKVGDNVGHLEVCAYLTRSVVVVNFRRGFLKFGLCR